MLIKIKPIIDKTGKGIDYSLLESNDSKLFPVISSSSIQKLSKEEVISTHCDVLILEALENTITSNTIDFLNTKALVTGANLAISEDVLEDLKEKDIIAMPCFVGGSGGSVVLNALFGSELNAKESLNYMGEQMRALTKNIIELALSENITPTKVDMRKISNMTFRNVPYKI